jgi:hypothetical protein
MKYHKPLIRASAAENPFRRTLPACLKEGGQHMTTETAPRSGDCLADLYARLEAEGANLDHLRAVSDAERRLRNSEAARLARLFLGKQEGRKITVSDLARHLEGVATRAYGVEAAVSTLVEQSPSRLADGVMRLVMELAEDLDRLSEASGAELMADLPAAQTAARQEPVIFSPFTMAVLEHRGARIGLKHCKKEGDRYDEFVAELDAMLLKLATIPCEAGEVPEKLGYLLHVHKEECGAHWREEVAPALFAALDMHFGDLLTADRARKEREQGQ